MILEIMSVELVKFADIILKFPGIQPLLLVAVGKFVQQILLLVMVVLGHTLFVIITLLEILYPMVIQFPGDLMVMVLHVFLLVLLVLVEMLLLAVKQLVALVLLINIAIQELALLVLIHAPLGNVEL